jgi:hypothetical protein
MFAPLTLSLSAFASSYEYEPTMENVASMLASVFRCPVSMTNGPLVTSIDVWMVALSVTEAGVGRELFY